MPDTTSATLARHAADRLHQTHGTAGRPAVVGFTKDENGNMVIVYADGCMARRVLTAYDWQWVSMVGPSYDALFVRETGAADD